MSHKPERQFPDDLSKVYSRLNQLDVEQFYAGYQWWITHRRISALQEEIDTLRLQIDVNAQFMHYARPQAVALATLARLQAHGVDDLDLLDRMLEQGEEWLDLIMQRLDYCEQLDFIDGNYTQWCEHALEGAYDWIDSMREAELNSSPSAGASSDIEATEELFLRKLTSEEEGEIPAAQAEAAEYDAVEELSVISIQQDSKQADAEAAELEATPATEAEDAVDLLAVSKMQENEQQPVELDSVPEVSPLESRAEVSEPTTAIEQGMEEQGIEAVQASEAAHVAGENATPTASFEGENEQQSVELALPSETLSSTEVEAGADPASVSSEQDNQEQLVESGETPEASLPGDVDAAEPVSVSSKQVLEEQAVKSPSTTETSLVLEGNAEVETLEVLTNEIPPQEDTGVDAVQEMPFPIEIDSAATVEEPLPTEIDEQDTTDEAHSEKKEAEATAGSEVPLPDEVNVASEVPVEEKLTGAAEESVEESPVVADAPEESASEEREDAEHAPVQDQKPKRRRSFWEFLLGLPGH